MNYTTQCSIHICTLCDGGHGAHVATEHLKCGWPELTGAANGKLHASFKDEIDWDTETEREREGEKEREREKGEYTRINLSW
jgi:hypothetical protein